MLIVGGGFGGLAAARALARAPVEVTLVDRHNLVALDAHRAARARITLRFGFGRQETFSRTIELDDRTLASAAVARYAASTSRPEVERVNFWPRAQRGVASFLPNCIGGTVSAARRGLSTAGRALSPAQQPPGPKAAFHATRPVRPNTCWTSIRSPDTR